MEVIVIQSEAFQKIMKTMDEIKEMIVEIREKQPLKEVWLDNKQTCQLLKISMRTLQAYRDEGRISFSQIGSKIYYKASDLDGHLNKHYIKAFRI